MSLTSNIKTLLSNAEALLTDDAPIEYRQLTSNPNAMPRVYSTNWTAIVGARTTAYAEQQVRDMDSGNCFRERTCRLRIPASAGVMLYVRSWVRLGGSTGLVWNVRGQLPTNVGTVVAYVLAHREPMLQDPRDGGV